MTLASSSLFSVTGKTVVLTGASGFLGRTFARVLLANGARVVAIGRSPRLEEQVSAWATEFGADRVCAHRVDMYDLAAFGQTLDHIVQKEPHIDVLVNNAHEL